MRRSVLSYLLVIVISLVLTCGTTEEDSEVYHFPNADLYPILDLGYRDSGPNPWSDGLALSPDGTTIVFGGWGNALWTMPSRLGRQTKITSLQGWEYSPRWCPLPGSDKLVFINEIRPFGTSFHLYTMPFSSTGTGEPKLIGSFKERIAAPSWSWDGNTIIFLKWRSNNNKR